MYLNNALIVLWLILLVGLLLCTPYSMCQNNVTYISPTTASCSNNKPCVTLDKLATNTSSLKSNNSITLVFLSGTHDLSHPLSLQLNRTITLNSLSSSLDATVNVSANASILISTSVELEIWNLNFTNALNVSLTSSNVILQNVVFHSSPLVVDGIERSNVDINDAKFSLDYSKTTLTIANMAEVRIKNIIVEDKYSPNCVSDHRASHSDSSDLTIHPAPDADGDTSMNVTIIESSFVRRSNTGISVFPYSQKCALESLPKTARRFYYRVNLTNFKNHKNCAIFFSISFQDPASVNFHFILDTGNISNNEFSSCNIREHAVGISIEKRKPKPFNSSTIEIMHSTFTSNKDFCESCTVVNLNKNLRHNVLVKDSKFHGNRGTPLVVYNSDLKFEGNVNFSRNTAHQGGALFLSFTQVHFSNDTNVYFRDNKAKDVGGAIYLDQPKLQIPDNHSFILCFYQFDNAITDLTQITAKIEFRNNTAYQGGEHIYGALMQSYCIANNEGTIYGFEVMNSTIFDFNPSLLESSSPVSSSPLRVCLCDSNVTFNCTNINNIFLEKEVYPGEVFTLSAVVVGADYGTTTGSVYAQLLPPHDSSPPSLSPQYQSQRVGNYSTCSQLSYSIHSPNQDEVLVLTATDNMIFHYGDKNALENDDPNSPILHFTTPIYINITLKKCPPGFNLSSETHGCECDSTLNKTGLSCDIEDGTGYVYRNKTNWVNARFDNSDNSTGVVVVKYCPYDYCDPTKVKVDLRYPDTQCNFNRCGTLCGECSQNYSLALGSNRCLPCSDNNNLALLIFFIAAGFLLVAFIRILNLTVHYGTINGLIFYANIVWAYRSILFPVSSDSDSQLHGAVYGFQVFIAWLNLDFGIETCFFVGLNAYWKTWLQFVFPLYIWIIAGVIIFTADYSEKVTKLIGKNGVPVLATLFLLSYTKLLRTIITVLNFSILKYPNGTRSYVWSEDGNLQYFDLSYRIILFVTALATLLILWLPYTLVLLLALWLKKIQKGSDEESGRIRRTIYNLVNNVKIKHFLDHYFAPFKDQHVYWLGVLLLVRIFLLMTFAFTSTSAPNANFIALGLTSALLILYSGYTDIYEWKHISLLETSFFYNLLVLAVAILYLDPHDDNHEHTRQICVSIGVAFVQFCGIVIFHVCLQVYFYCKHKNLPRDHESEHKTYKDMCKKISKIVRKWWIIKILTIPTVSSSKE